MRKAQSGSPVKDAMDSVLRSKGVIAYFDTLPTLLGTIVHTVSFGGLNAIMDAAHDLGLPYKLIGEEELYGTGIKDGAVLVNMPNKNAQLDSPQHVQDIQILTDGINAEISAISQYEAMAATTSDDKSRTQIENIIKEEKVHLGEFINLLAQLDPESAKAFSDGANEVKSATAKTAYILKPTDSQNGMKKWEVRTEATDVNLGWVTQYPDGICDWQAAGEVKAGAPTSGSNFKDPHAAAGDMVMKTAQGVYDVMRGQNPGGSTVTFHCVEVPATGYSTNKTVHMDDEGKVTVFGIGQGSIEDWIKNYEQYGTDKVEWYAIDGGEQVKVGQAVQSIPTTTGPNIQDSVAGDVQEDEGSESRVKPEDEGYVVDEYKKAQVNLSVGDRVQVDFPRDFGSAPESYIATVEEVADDGTVSVRYDKDDSLGVLISQNIVTKISSKSAQVFEVWGIWPNGSRDLIKSLDTSQYPDEGKEYVEDDAQILADAAVAGGLGFLDEPPTRAYVVESDNILYKTAGLSDKEAQLGAGFDYMDSKRVDDESGNIKGYTWAHVNGKQWAGQSLQNGISDKDFDSEDEARNWVKTANLTDDLMNEKINWGGFLLSRGEAARAAQEEGADSSLINGLGGPFARAKVNDDDAGNWYPEMTGYDNYRKHVDVNDPMGPDPSKTAQTDDQMASMFHHIQLDGGWQPQIKSREKGKWLNWGYEMDKDSASTVSNYVRNLMDADDSRVVSRAVAEGFGAYISDSMRKFMDEFKTADMISTDMGSLEPTDDEVTNDTAPVCPNCGRKLHGQDLFGAKVAMSEAVGVACESCGGQFSKTAGNHAVGDEITYDVGGAADLPEGTLVGGTIVSVSPADGSTRYPVDGFWVRRNDQDASDDPKDFIDETMIKTAQVAHQCPACGSIKSSVTDTDDYGCECVCGDCGHEWYDAGSLDSMPVDVYAGNGQENAFSHDTEWLGKLADEVVVSNTEENASEKVSSFLDGLDIDTLSSRDSVMYVAEKVLGAHADFASVESGRRERYASYSGQTEPAIDTTAIFK